MRRGGDARAFGCCLEAASRHQLRHAARQSVFTPFGDDSDQSRIFDASRSICPAGKPASMASLPHPSGSAQSAGRREAFFWTPLGVFSLWVVGRVG